MLQIVVTSAASVLPDHATHLRQGQERDQALTFEQAKLVDLCIRRPRWFAILNRVVTLNVLSVVPSNN